MLLKVTFTGMLLNLKELIISRFENPFLITYFPGLTLFTKFFFFEALKNVVESFKWVVICFFKVKKSYTFSDHYFFLIFSIKFSSKELFISVVSELLFSVVSLSSNSSFILLPSKFSSV